jgi:hypothetical protein
MFRVPDGKRVEVPRVLVMAVRADEATLPQLLLRFLALPAAVGALIATAAAVLRRRTRQPSVPRMSEHWLRGHDVDYRRDLPW